MDRTSRIAVIAAACAAAFLTGTTVAPAAPGPGADGSGNHYPRRIFTLIGDNKYVVYGVGHARRNGRFKGHVTTYVRTADGSRWKLPATGGKWRLFSLAGSSLTSLMPNQSPTTVQWWDLARRTHGSMPLTSSVFLGSAPGGFITEDEQPITNATELTFYHWDGSHDDPFIVSPQGVWYDETPGPNGYLLSNDVGDAMYATWVAPTAFTTLSPDVGPKESLHCAPNDVRLWLGGTVDAAGAGCSTFIQGDEDSGHARIEYLPLDGSPARVLDHPGGLVAATTVIGNHVVFTHEPTAHPQYFVFGPHATRNLGRIGTAQPFTAYGKLVFTSRSGTRLIAATVRGTHRRVLAGLH
jgi:hypothetical protein